MSAVDLWKARQAPLSQCAGSARSEWPIVGIGENAALDRLRMPKTERFPTALNSISALSPTTIHRTL
jgi:hypothetical protein